MNKSEMRKHMRALRSGIEEREEKSAQICRNILSMPEFASAKCVMLYMPIGSEADVRRVIREAQRMGKTVCLPVCRENGCLDAVEYTTERCLVSGVWGIREPQGSVISPGQIDLVLCPGLAFDLSGGRLGYGKGYYDRFLENVHAFWAGICYNECVVDAVPAEAHDVPMHAIVSQTGTMYIKGMNEDEGHA